jgi:Domain of unknown function (DUF4157)
MQHAFASGQTSKPGAAVSMRAAPQRGVAPHGMSNHRILQRTCACGTPARSAVECTGCKAKREPPRLRAKTLAINKPGDTFEQEADRIAEQVIRMAAPVALVGAAREPAVQRRSAHQAAPETAPPIVHDVLRSPGNALDADTRAFMEPRFGQDFSKVRVHTGTKAAESARAVNALAYTVGPDVVFRAGQYAPETFEGRRLIAHELTHVLQQSGNRNSSKTVNSIADPLGETASQADTLASGIANSRSSTSKDGIDRDALKIRHDAFQLSASPPAIQRDDWGWPTNGYVINESSKPVTVWSDVKGLYEIKPNSTSERFSEDVDHIKDKNGQWYKIGPFTVTVNENEVVVGYECKVSSYGRPCTWKW